MLDSPKYLLEILIKLLRRLWKGKRLFIWQSLKAKIWVILEYLVFVISKFWLAWFSYVSKFNTDHKMAIVVKCYKKIEQFPRKNRIFANLKQMAESSSHIQFLLVHLANLLKQDDLPFLDNLLQPHHMLYHVYQDINKSLLQYHNASLVHNLILKGRAMELLHLVVEDLLGHWLLLSCTLDNNYKKSQLRYPKFHISQHLLHQIDEHRSCLYPCLVVPHANSHSRTVYHLAKSLSR